MASYVTEKISSLKPSGRSMADKYIEILEQIIKQFQSNTNRLRTELKTFITAGRSLIEFMYQIYL